MRAPSCSILVRSENTTCVVSHGVVGVGNCDDVARAPLAAPRDLLPSPFRQGKRTMFHFLQDMVHSVAAEPNKNGHRVSIHWHEVVLLSLLCLRFVSK